MTQPDRDEILSRFLDDLAVDGEAVLRYAQAHPELAQDFYDCAILSKALGGLTPSQSERDMARNRGLTAEELELAARLDQYMQRAQANQEPAPAAPALESIVSEANRLGTSPRSLCSQLRLPTSVVAKLDRRLLDPDTVPDRLIEQLAEILRRSREEVQKYLSRPPTLSATASYRAWFPPTVQETKPALDSLWAGANDLAAEDADLTVAEEIVASETAPSYTAPPSRSGSRQSFAEAVQNALDMNEADRQYWLKENPS